MRSASRNAAFFDSIAAAYDAQLDATPATRWVRDAFRQLASELIPPDGVILDFGCGTGTDSAWLADQGHLVISYDRSAGMVARLREKCARHLEQGRIRVYEGGFETFLSRMQHEPALSAVISNFAVFNLIEDLVTVCQRLGDRLLPGGHLIISVMNPLFWKDLLTHNRRAMWLRSLRQPSVRVTGGETDLFRYRVRAIQDAAGPDLKLVRQASVGALIRRSRGPRVWAQPTTLAERIEAGLWRTYPLNRLGEFIFLAFQRR